MEISIGWRKKNSDDVIFFRGNGEIDKDIKISGEFSYILKEKIGELNLNFDVDEKARFGLNYDGEKASFYFKPLKKSKKFIYGIEAILTSFGALLGFGVSPEPYKGVGALVGGLISLYLSRKLGKKLESGLKFEF